MKPKFNKKTKKLVLAPTVALKKISKKAWGRGQDHAVSEKSANLSHTFRKSV